MTRAFAIFILLAAAPGAASADDYELRTAEASLSITPAPGHELHRGAGVVIRLAAPPEVTLKKKRLGLADAADPRADAPRFDIAFTAAAPGSYTIRADVRFWLCAKKTCRPIRATVDVPVTSS